MSSFHSCIVKIRYIGRSCCTKKQLLRHSLILLHCLDYLFWTQGMHAVVSGAQRAWFWTPSGSCFSTIRRRARLWMSALRKIHKMPTSIFGFGGSKSAIYFTIISAFPGCFTNNKLKTVAILAQVCLFCSQRFHIIFVHSAWQTESLWFFYVATHCRYPAACRCVEIGFERY